MKKKEKTLQELSHEYSQLCMRLGDVIHKIDLLIEEKDDIKKQMSVVNKEAVVIQAKDKKKEEAKEVTEVKFNGASNETTTQATA